MIIFNQAETSALTPTKMQEIYTQAKKLKRNFQSISIEDIIDILDQLAKQWSQGTEFYQRARAHLIAEQVFSNKIIDETLQIIPTLLKRQSLEKRLDSEFRNRKCLDQFATVDGFAGKITITARGVLTHITAGNVFVSFIDSWLMGVITKNINIIKVSSHNTIFPEIFYESLKAIDHKKILIDKFSLLQWKGGDSSLEKIVKNESDSIIAWGGEEMVESYRQGLSLKTKLIDYGPKISFQLLTETALKNNDLTTIAKKIVQEISAWDQQACASPQNLFYPVTYNVNALMQEIAKELNVLDFNISKPSENEQVERLKEIANADYHAANGVGLSLHSDNFILHQENDLSLRPSPLFRSLILKPYSTLGELYAMLEHFSFYLQSCSVLSGVDERESILRNLSLSGVARIAKLGDLMLGMEGAPHDGRYGLTELVRFIPFEASENFDEKMHELKQSTPYYSAHPDSLTSSKTFKQHSLDQGFDLLKNGTLDFGMMFSSGGTSGAPKYTLFTKEEFKTVASMLSHGFISQGLRPHMKCMNLFAAGNLWSSFLAVHDALNLCDVVNFPMGANAPMDFIFDTIERFQPDAIFGIPSTLLDLALEAEKRKLKLSIPMMFYAGEKLNRAAQVKITSIFNTHTFGSAGYATVDAGVIGYQDKSCETFEHYLFSQYVHLEIIDQEAVVTSKVREKMPVIHYRTGDQIEWTGKKHPQTGDPQFKLLGRIDQQINIWGCRLFINEIEHALEQVHSDHLNLQIVLTLNNNGEDQLELRLQGAQKIDQHKFATELLKASSDLKKSLTLDYLHAKLVLKQVDSAQIEHVARTGKMKQIIDLRN